MQRDWIGDLVYPTSPGNHHPAAICQAGSRNRSVSIVGRPGIAFGAGIRPGLDACGGWQAADIGQAGIEHVSDTSKGTINLYSSWPLTGSSEQIGGDAVEAVKLAISDFGGAAGGFALNYEAMDDGIAANNGSWDAATESDNVTKVVNDADAMVYMATYNSGAAKISMPITNEAGMAQISYANTYVGLTRAMDGVTEEGEPDIYFPTGKINYMRTVPADDIQGNAAANWAYGELGARKAYILHDNQPYGKGVAKVFQLKFEELGGEVLGFEAFVADAGDYQSLMAGIADQEPDLLYLGAIVNLNASKLLLDMRDFMSVDDVTFLGPDGLINQDFVDGAGEAGNGAYITFGGVTGRKPRRTRRGLRDPHVGDSRSHAGCLRHVRLRDDGGRDPGDRQGRREGPRQDSGCDVRHQGLRGSARHHLVVHRNGRHQLHSNGSEPDPGRADRLSEGDRITAFRRGDVDGTGAQAPVSQHRLAARGTWMHGVL